MNETLISREEMRELIKQATREAVEESFVKAGMDINDPISLQKDQAFIRSARLARERMTSKVFLSVISVLVTSALGFMVAGLLGWIKTGGQ